MRFPRPRSSSKSASSSSISVSGTVSVVGSVKSSLKAKLGKNKSGKYSQKMLKRGGSSAKKQTADAAKDLPKLADLTEDMPVVVEEGRDTNKIDLTSGRDGSDANVEERDGPPEDEDEDEAEEVRLVEPIVTTTATATEVAAAPEQQLQQPPATPKSPVIFGFHAVPSTSPAPLDNQRHHRPRALSSANLLQTVAQLLTPTNRGHKRCQSWGAESTVVDDMDMPMPYVPDTSKTPTALPSVDVISPVNSGESEYSANTALSIHSQEVEMCPKEKKGTAASAAATATGAEVGEISSNDNAVADTLRSDELGQKEALVAAASEVKVEESINETSKTEAAATDAHKTDKPPSTVKDEKKEDGGKKPNGLTYITPSVLAAASSEHSANGEISTKLSMRSTVLVEDADDADDTAEGETDNEEAAMTTQQENDAPDDEEEDEGEDEYESDYDGSLADESAEHVVASPRNKPTSPRNDAKKKRRSKVNEKRLRDGHRRACKYLKNGDFPRALEEFEGILDELMNSLGDSHRRVGSALHNVGIVNIRADNLDDAVDALEEAIRIRKDVHGPDHPKVADSLLELGIALLSQKDYEDALEIFNDALEIRENDLVEEARHGSDEDRIHCVLQVAKALNNIACVYFEYGSLSKALKTLEDVLEMQKEAIDELTERDPDYKQAKLSLATTYCNIGYVHADNADWDNAIEFLDRAYAVSSTPLRPTFSFAVFACVCSLLVSLTVFICVYTPLVTYYISILFLRFKQSICHQAAVSQSAP